MSFEADLKELVSDTGKYTSHLDFLGPSIVSAAETIEKTKRALLKEARSDPSIRLLLYTDEEQILPWWSNVLHRLAIAQHFIGQEIKGKEITLQYAKSSFPLESESTLRQILTAIYYSVPRVRGQSSEEKYEILKGITFNPERYERINTWNISKREYIYKCMAGFLNCYTFVYREKPSEDIRVAQLGKSYGYFKTNDDLIGIVAYEHLLSPRRSMKWFAEEVAHVLMYDFEWEQAIQWARYVYKTLTLGK